MNYQEIRGLVDDQFDNVNTVILDHLDSSVPLINEVGTYIIKSGGKRLRPLVCLLSANALQYQGDIHIKVAAITEFLHTATLLHDDVVDESALRRGQSTVNEVWGNATSILVGDYLISKSFQMIVRINHLRLMEIIAEATAVITEGEVLQLINIHNPNTSQDHYMDIIRSKTAKMFEVAAQSGAILAEASQEQEQAMVNYARHMGAAFQLIDDVLDYTGSADALGKNVGDDLAEGKPTLPLIYAQEHCSKNERSMIQNAIKHGGLDNLDEIIAAVKSSGGIEFTIQAAEQEADKAIQALEVIPDSVYRTAMMDLARLAVNRNT